MVFTGICCVIGFLSGCGLRNRLPDPQVVPGPVLSPKYTEAVRTARTEEPVRIPSATPSLTPSPLPSATPALITYDVPVYSQDGLFLDGVPTGVGCVPVCIEMMTAWWNSIDPEHQILTAQEVIDRNAEQGSYVAGRGMSSGSAADELAEIGYRHEMKINSSKEELLADLDRHGPVGVLVKTNWVPTTMNHAAVLTSYDESTDMVRLNDPFYGSEVSWSWEAFDGIWGLNYAGDRDYSGDVVRRVYFVIYPE